MNTSSLRAASMCSGPPTPGGAAPTPSATSLARRRADVDGYYNNCVTGSSRRPSHCCSEISTSSRQHMVASHPSNQQQASSVYDSATTKHQQHHHLQQQQQPPLSQQQQQHWTSYRTDVTGTSIRTPVSSGKFRTNFSFRQALVPEGYPKMDHERNPRRESFVAEFSRKLAEGYDIWEDEDRPVINWAFPRLPIRKNKTHELRMMANRERITRMLEREKQMNKRNTRLPASADKRETAWWERSNSSRNGGGLLSRTPVPSTPRGASGSSHTGNHRGWSSNVSARHSFTAPKGGYYGGGGGGGGSSRR